jgi:beta-glucuronidase
MVRAADRLGFLVWSEIPVYWNVDFGNPYTVALGRQQLSEMIERDRNRASVIIWSIGNETPISDERNEFMRGLAVHARELDDTRLISGAIVAGMELIGPMMARSVLPTAIGFGPEEWTMELDTDPLAEILDVPALNQYWGWYYSVALAAFTPFSAHEMRQVVIDNLHRIRIRTSFEKPLIISEFGAGALEGMRADEEDLAVFSEDYQALVYRKQLEMLSKQDNVRGMSPWILKDFRSTMRLYQGVQDYWNLKGLVSDEGEKKLAFAVVRDHYLERKSENRKPEPETTPGDEG